MMGGLLLLEGLPQDMDGCWSKRRLTGPSKEWGCGYRSCPKELEKTGYDLHALAVSRRWGLRPKRPGRASARLLPRSLIEITTAAIT